MEKYLDNNIIYNNSQLLTTKLNNLQIYDDNYEIEQLSSSVFVESESYDQYDKTDQYDSDSANFYNEKKSYYNLNDPWDISINDNKFIMNNKIIRIFPHLKNLNNYSKLLIDPESFSYITIREIADLTSKIICYHLIKYNINPQKVKIIDYTAGVGGNVLSFSKYFNHIYAIEISKQRYEYLINNVEIYGYKNITCINDSAICFTDNDLIKINPNVIFIDPPWGGVEYKNTDLLQLKLGNLSIEELIIKIFKLYSQNFDYIKNINFLENNNKFIILKLPKNYDIEYFYHYIKKNNIIKNYTICLYLYILNKMLIVVCEFINY